MRLYTKRDVGFMLFLGIAGIFPYTILLYLAFSLAPESAGVINIINYTWPLWVIILSVLILKEKLTFRKVLGILLGIIFGA